MFSTKEKKELYTKWYIKIMTQNNVISLRYVAIVNHIMKSLNQWRRPFLIFASLSNLTILLLFLLQWAPKTFEVMTETSTFLTVADVLDQIFKAFDFYTYPFFRYWFLSKCHLGFFGIFFWYTFLYLITINIFIKIIIFVNLFDTV